MAAGRWGQSPRWTAPGPTDPSHSSSRLVGAPAQQLRSPRQTHHPPCGALPRPSAEAPSRQPGRREPADGPGWGWGGGSPTSTACSRDAAHGVPGTSWGPHAVWETAIRPLRFPDGGVAQASSGDSEMEFSVLERHTCQNSRSYSPSFSATDSDPALKINQVTAQDQKERLLPMLWGAQGERPLFL